MAFTRPFPAIPTLTAMFIASGATSLVAPSNAGRTDLKLQGADAFWMGVASGVPSGPAGMPGVLIPSGVITPAAPHTGAVYAFSAAANGATIAIRAWESTAG
jgi:hypothetical protein